MPVSRQHPCKKRADENTFAIANTPVIDYINAMPTSSELKAFLKTHKISRETAAAITCHSQHTLNGWLLPETSAGHRDINPAAWQLLKLYVTEQGRAALAALQ